MASFDAWINNGGGSSASGGGLTTFSFERYGGVSGDSSASVRTANNAAWEAMILAIGPLATRLQARAVFDAAASYYFAGPIHLRHTLVLTGVAASSAFNQNVPGSSGTTLFFPPTGRGLVIDYSAADVTGNGSGSYVSFLQVVHDHTLSDWQANHSYVNGSAVCPIGGGVASYLPSKWTGYVFINNGSTGTSGGSQPAWTDGMTTPTITEGQTISDGGVTWTATLCPLIDVRTVCYLQNVYAGFAYGDGIRVYGNTTDSIADLCEFRNIWAWNNLSCGLHVVGNDANANLFQNISAVANGGYGVYDVGFLQNRYVNLHLSDNGANPWEALRAYS